MLLGAHSGGGDAKSGAGGPEAPICMKKRPMTPSSAQAQMPSRPPGRSTRAISRAVTSWRGANMQPIVESTTSKLTSSNGSASASPSTHRTSTPAAAASLRPATNSSGGLDRDPTILSAPPAQLKPEPSEPSSGAI